MSPGIGMHSIGRVTVKCGTSGNHLISGNLKFTTPYESYHNQGQSSSWSKRMRASGGGGLKNGGHSKPAQRPGSNRV